MAHTTIRVRLTVDDMASAIMDDIIEAERDRRKVLDACDHCGRPLRVDPGARGLCRKCARLAGHAPEERLLRAIHGHANPCDRCAGARV